MSPFTEILAGLKFLEKLVTEPKLLDSVPESCLGIDGHTCWIMPMFLPAKALERSAKTFLMPIWGSSAGGAGVETGGGAGAATGGCG